MKSAAAGDTTARPWKRPTLWLIFLGSFFFITYGLANWLAGQRANVGAIVFGWERYIPYLPWTIVPYWSIDLFYGISLFVCATRKELDTHAKRLLTAQVIAVTCFVLFPLRQTFVRPDTDGFYGWMLDALLAFDKPFNQAPALHIALLTVLWVLYARYLQGHTRFFMRWLLHAWFALIGVSVLTTFQHHFIDVPTGLLLGCFCIWLFPDDKPSLFARATLTGDPRRHTLATRYFTGALATAMLALWLGGWGWWLLWVSSSLALVAAIYPLLDAGAFGKQADGSMQPASLWLLAPYLIGATINSRWWTRRHPQADCVTPELWIGRIPLRLCDVPQGVRTIIDLCAELPCAHGDAHYVGVPALDLVALDVDDLRRAADAIDDAAKSGTVLVCCALGFSRSAAAAAAWLTTSGRAANADEAVRMVNQARPGIVLNSEQAAELRQLAIEVSR